MGRSRVRARLLLLAMLAGVAGINPAAAQSNGVHQEIFTGITGAAIADLTNAIAYPGSPSATAVLTNFEADTGIGDYYGQRLRALVVPPVTGDYYFWIASDDAGELYLSTDENPANKRRIAAVSGWTNPREWTKEAGQKSAAMLLTNGRRYYLEALQKENTGGDNLAVRWQLPGGALEEPIPAARLVYLTAPTVATQPVNATVQEGETAVFNVQALNFIPPAFQWRRAGANLPGATGATLSFTAVLADQGAGFSCVLSNALGMVTSAVATLSVIADTNKPSLVRAQNLGLDQIAVTFSEPVEAASGTNKSNYAVTGGISILSAAQSADPRTILLRVSALTLGASYTVTVNNVRDQALAANVIQPNSAAAFMVTLFTSQDVGSPAMAGSLVSVAGGMDVTGAGTDIAGTGDQFQFGFQPWTGDFDLKVRLARLEYTDILAKAGLMARESLTANSRHAAVFATPSLNGCFFQSRASTGGASSTSGSLPVNPPSTWLRLKRTGTTLSGYAGFDGQTWLLLGSVSLSGLPSTIYFGMAVTSRNASQATTAQFRDFSEASGAVRASLRMPAEPAGPTSRRTGIVITEIMYKPAPRADQQNLEFVELFNSNPFYEDLGGWRLSGDIDYTFPAGTLLRGGEYLVVAASPASILNVYGMVNAMGPYTNTLKTSGTIRLRNEQDSILLEINYGNRHPWPAGADETGHSLVLARPSYGENDPRAWAVSDAPGGSPGQADGFRPGPERNVVINEFLARATPPLMDYVELYNHGNEAVDLSGFSLSDSPISNKMILPSGSIIPARGFLVFHATNLNFALEASGETLYLRHAADGSLLDAVDFGPQAEGVAQGRWPDGAEAFYPLTLRTPGTNNSGLWLPDVVINEIMFEPLSGLADDEYVELYNRGPTAVDLGNWRLTDGVEFMFPSPTVLAPGAYLVVAKNATNLIAKYSQLNGANTLGDFSGTLANRGERLALAMPVYGFSTNALGQVKTNVDHVEVCEVHYRPGGRWGRWINGGGSSLELKDARANPRLAANWGGSDETRKNPALWTTVEWTGVLDHGATWNNTAIDRLEVTLLGEGECLLDNVEVIGPGGTNLLSAADANFESGLGNWVAQGSHVRSALESSEGYLSSKSLHLRASQRGDTGANRLRVAIPGVLAAGQTATLRARVRWLAGWPEIVLRLKGNYLEAYGRLLVPPNTGTPGLANSIRVDNAGPALFAVTHNPPAPTAGETVVVTAQAQDPDGLATLVLRYRLDPSASYTSVSMKDDGTGGDEIAGDGVYSAAIPGQAAGLLVAFYLEARDAAVPFASSLFPADAPVRECLVRFGDPMPGGSFGVYRFWLTQSNVNRWIGLPSLSNEDIEGTFVYGNTRVIYNIGGHYSGSPYHQGYSSPVSANCQYNLSLPPDDLLLGTDNFNKIHMPGNGPGDDATLQREQTAYWMARQLGLPWNYRRYVVMYVNGTRKGSLMEDTQVPGAEVIRAVFPDEPDGNLYKLQPWFEFDDVTVSGGTQAAFNNKSWCTLNNYATTTGKKTARYRYNYLVRAADNTANDFAPVFELVDAANTYADGDFVNRMETLADMEQWMRTFAIEHAVGNWDSFGYQNSQNMYGYKPRAGKWRLLIWDFNIVLGNSGSHGPNGDNLWNNSGSGTPMPQIYQKPAFRRMYLRGFKDIINGPMSPGQADQVMDAKYAAFVANGLNPTAPAATKTWIATMRASLLTALTNEGVANVAFASSLPAHLDTANNSLNLAGTAPVEVHTLKVNGFAYPVTWNSVAAWNMPLALQPGTNTLIVEGFSHDGQKIPGLTFTNTVRYTGAPPSGTVVFNEIMAQASAPGAEYVELFNAATNFTWDLSGWRINGLDYTFPAGALLPPQSFLVLAANRAAFGVAYGAAPAVFGEFSGQPQKNGETLSLLRPLADGSEEVVDRVRYEAVPPWPPAAPGHALQLLDTSRDNCRVANWSSGLTWQFASVTGTNLTVGANTNLTIQPYWQGEMYIDDIMLVSGAVPGAGSNLLRNGDFELPLLEHWTVSTNLTNSAISTDIKHSGNACLRLVADSPGTSISKSIFQSVPVTNGGVYTLSFWYLPSTTLTSLQMRVTSQVRLTVPVEAGSVLATPGEPNTARTSLPELPLVWLNEAQPQNLQGPLDNLGERDPWVEIYNSGVQAVSLEGWFLTDDYQALDRWAFPPGTVIAPGQFLLVWADGQPAQTDGTNLHTNFRLAASSGSIALVMPINGAPAVLDYLNYDGLPEGWSHGNYPDAQPFYRRAFYYETPLAPNDPARAPLNVLINEYMASNTRTIADPSDGRYEDWFELFNAGPEPADLQDCYLTDNLSNPAKFKIPSGYVIPPGGFLLVWADENSSQSSTNPPRLHVNFQLSRNGEALGLYAKDGIAIDVLTFGPQADDLSEGRWPDGASQIVRLTNATPGLANWIPATNHPPVLNVVGNKTVTEETLLSFACSASDLDAGQTLVFSLAEGAPAGANLDSNTGLFTWLPVETQGPGQYVLTIRVTDNGLPPLTAAETITVTVLENNRPPVLSPIADVQINEHATLDLQLQASDPDFPTNLLFFSFAALPPPGAILDTLGRLTWQPGESQGPGEYSLAVRITDNGMPPLSATQSFIVTVQEANEAPTAAGIPPQTLVEGNPFDLQLAATDADQPAQGLAFSLLSGPADAHLNATGLFTWTPAEEQGPSSNLVTFRVMDNGLPPLSTTGSFVVVVLESNQAPLLAAIANQVAYPAQPVAFSCSASDGDRPAQALTFSLDAGAPNGAVISPGGLFTWTPAAGQAHTTNVLTVRVTDDGSPPLSATQSFIVTVGGLNQPPTIAPLGDVVLMENTSLHLPIDASDSDWPPQTLTYLLLPGSPTNALLDPARGTLTWNPWPGAAGATNWFFVSVVDNGLPALAATQSFAVLVVSTNDLPPPERVLNVVEGQAQAFVAGPLTNGRGAPLFYAVATGPAHAELTASGPNTFLYQPAAYYNGQDRFWITVSDGAVTSAPIAVQVFINAVNDVAPYLFEIMNSFDVFFQPVAVAVGDFNKDGKADLISANRGSGLLSLLLGDGLGDFRFLREIELPGGAEAVVAADFNKDGLLDLAVANGEANQASLLLGLGAGAFLSPQKVATRSNAVALAAGDFNKDGLLDLAVTTRDSRMVQVFRGNGSGGMVTPTELAAGAGPRGLAVGDFNKDGKLDLAVVNELDDTVSVFQGNGVLGFSAPQTLPVGPDPAGLAVADFNKDGRSDLAVANRQAGTLTVALANSAGGFLPSQTLEVNGYPSALLASDFNKDGWVDLAWTDETDGSVRVLLGQTNGLFRNYHFDEGAYFPLAGGPCALSTNDFNKDGNLDLVVVLRDLDQLAVLLNNHTPVAKNGILNCLEDARAPLRLLGSAGPLRFTLKTWPQYGALEGAPPDLVYVPQPDYFGKDTLSFVVDDGRQTSKLAKISINVLPINDRPAFELTTNLVIVPEDAGTISITPLTINISKGPANESAQRLKFDLIPGNPGLFKQPPTVSSLGLLRFASGKNLFGESPVTLWLTDSGGTAYGGADRSEPRTFTVRVLDVNDAPTLGAIGPKTILEDGEAVWRFAVTDLETAPHDLQVTVVSTNANLAPPSSVSILADGTNRTVVVRPLAHQNGKTLLTFTVSDGHASVSRSTTLIVTAVNDPPSFGLLTNRLAVACLPVAQAILLVNTNQSSAGPPNENNQLITYPLINPNRDLFLTQPAVSAGGVLTFKPKGLPGMVILTVTAKDTGGTSYGGVNSSPAQTLVLELTP